MARSADATVDAAEIVKALIGRFGGKGGGRPEGAQAGGLDREPQTIRLAAYELLRRRIAALVVGLAIDLGGLFHLVDVSFRGLEQRLDLKRGRAKRASLSRRQPVVDPAAQLTPAEQPVEQIQTPARPTAPITMYHAHVGIRRMEPQQVHHLLRDPSTSALVTLPAKLFARITNCSHWSSLVCT